MATDPGTDPARDAESDAARDAGSAAGSSVTDWPLGRLLSTAARLVEQDWNAVLADFDLTHAGLVALATLQNGPLTQGELAAASRVEQQTMSRVVERLERTGHVVRRRDGVDRRRLVISLSASGQQIVGEVTGSDIAERLVADWVEDVAQFRAELVRLVERGGGKSSRSHAVRHPH